MVLMLANLKWLKYLDNKCVFFCNLSGLDFLGCHKKHFESSLMKSFRNLVDKCDETGMRAGLENQENISLKRWTAQWPAEY